MSRLKPSALFVPDIKQMVADKSYRDLKRALAEINPADLAEGFGAFTSFEKVVVFKLLPVVRAMEVFEELDASDQAYLLSTLEPGVLGPILEGMEPSEASSLFHRMPDRAVKRMMSLAGRVRREGLAQPTDFPPHTAGGLMHTDVLELRPSHTAQQALENVRAASRLHRMHDLNILYVTDAQGRLLGSMSPRALIAAPRDMRLSEIMSPVQLIKIRADMDQEEAAKIFQRFKLLAAPVVDQDNRLLGVLSGSDILSVVSQEATEDIQKLAGMEALDEPYFQISFWRMIKKRATWLCVLFLGEMLTATAMAFFEHEISRAVVLALFIPLIISSGGNSGSQAGTLIVRALALQEVTLKDWWRVMRREFYSGLALGGVLGTIGFLRIFLWAQFTNIYGPHYLLVAATVSFSLVLVVLWGSVSGSLLPILLRRVGLDPAVVSAPFVATLVDVTGLVIYFSIAMVIMRGTLL
jgi:magnesium transporter